MRRIRCRRAKRESDGFERRSVGAGIGAASVPAGAWTYGGANTTGSGAGLGGEEIWVLVVAGDGEDEHLVLEDDELGVHGRRDRRAGC